MMNAIINQFKLVLLLYITKVTTFAANTEQILLF